MMGPMGEGNYCYEPAPEKGVRMTGVIRLSDVKKHRKNLAAEKVLAVKPVRVVSRKQYPDRKGVEQ